MAKVVLTELWTLKQRRFQSKSLSFITFCQSTIWFTQVPSALNWTIWMKLVIPTWRQEELLAWQPLFDICQAKHTHTVYIQHTGNCFKHWLRLEKLTTLHGSNKHYCLHSSRGKQLQNVTNLSSASFLLQHTHTLSQHSPPPSTTSATTNIHTPPLGPLQPATCLWRSPLTSAAKLGTVPTLWALDGCSRSEKQFAVSRVHGTNSAQPAQTHLMTRKNRTGPFLLLFFCVSQTWKIKGDTCDDEWYALLMARIINRACKCTVVPQTYKNCNS